MKIKVEHIKVLLAKNYANRIKREFAEEVKSFPQIDLLDTYQYYKEREKNLSQEELIYLEVLKNEIEIRKEEI